MKTVKIFITYFITLIAVIVFSSSAFAAETDDDVFPWEKFTVRIGGFATTLNSDVRVGPDSVKGIDLDMEEALDLDTSLLVLRTEAAYRLGDKRRHGLHFGYFALNRDGERRIGREINFGDETFLLGTDVRSFLDIEIYKGRYSYSFFSDDRVDLAGSFGVYVMPVKVGLETTTGGISESEELTAPLPVIGFHSNFAVTPNVFLKQDLEISYLEIDEYKGTLGEGSVLVEYNMWDYLGIGGGLNFFRINVESEGDDFAGIDFIGNVKMSYTGLLFYAKIYFK